MTDEAAWDRVLDGVGPLAGLVSCAGIRTRSAIVDTSAEEFERHLRVNVTATWLGIRGLLRRHRPRTAASVVNVASVSDARACCEAPGSAPPDSCPSVFAMAYRVTIDQDECMSVGRCVADFPAGFGFDDDELATVLATVGELSDQQLLRAAHNCPSRAIAVFDADGNQLG